MRKFRRSLIQFVSLLVVFSIFTCFTAGAETYYVDGVYKFRYQDDGTAMIAEYYSDSNTLVIPDTLLDHKVTSVEVGAFQDNTQFEYILFGKYFTTISAKSFSGSAIKELVLPESMEMLVWSSFSNCSQLSSVIIKDSSLTTIPRTCFYNCTKLDTVDLGNNITTIEKYAFSDCTSLRTIFIPKTTTSISSDAFENCPNLTIYGYADSYAEEYANINKISFVAIRENELGDVDLSGVIDIKDSTSIQKHLAEIEMLDDTQLSVADFNQDGGINIIDATAIQKYLVS